MKKNFTFRSIVAIFATSTLFACTQDVMDSLPMQTESKAELDFGVTSTATYNFTYDIEILPYITH